MGTIPLFHILDVNSF